MDEPTYVRGFHDDKEVVKMTYQPLGNTGLRVSRMGLGGGPLGGIYEHMEEEEAISMVQKAIRSGINYIDTAPWYGQGKSESIIGKALKSIPREAYYIGSKVGRYDLDLDKMFDFSAEKVYSSVEKSLKLLGLSYIDILQIHDIEYADNLNQILQETLLAAQKLVNEGKARFIGITGYYLSVLKEVAEKSSVKIDCVLSYARNTLIDDELKKYIPYFKNSGIGVIDAGALGLGMLTSTGTLPSWHPAPEKLKKACRDARLYCKENEIDLAHLALHHNLSLEGASTLLVGCGSMEVFEKNWKTFTTKLTEKEKECTEQVKQRFFVPLKFSNWEETLVADFRKMRREKVEDKTSTA